MQESAEFLLAMAGILLLGAATDVLGKRTFLPRVTLLLIFGVIIGDQVLDLIPDLFVNHFELIAEMALVMVGFLLGGRLNIKDLKRTGKKVLWISTVSVIVTSLVVSVGLYLVGMGLGMAILLGCISSATAPAACVDIVYEMGIKSRFADYLLSIVALDDAWGLMIFSIGIAFVATLSEMTVEISPALFALKEIGGALVLGIFLGLPAAYLTGRIKPGQPMLTEALGLVFLCGGLAIWLEVSFLIASMAMGAVVSNLAKHHEQPFHAIEGIEWPFMIVFFIVAGASLELNAFLGLGIFGSVYVVCRIMGKVIGAAIGCHIGAANRLISRWMGIAMLPQAGAAIGMALVASNYFPQYRQMVLSIIIGSTVLFELVGPIFTRAAIFKTRSVG